MLPSQFCIVLDVLTDAETHYVGMYAYFPDGNAPGYKPELLAFSTLEEETSLSADIPYEFFHFVLDLFNKTYDSIVAFVSDNCSANKLISRKLGGYLVRCANQRYALDKKDLPIPYRSINDKVRKVMTRFRYPIPSAKLKKFTPLKSKNQ